MMNRFVLVVLALLLLIPSSSQAATAIKQPDLLSFGAGYYDFDKSEHMRKAGDLRLEYRWGLSLLPLIDSSLRSWDSAVQFHPTLGFETTTRGALYGNGGYAMDWYMTKHWVFSWSEGAGFFYRGNGNRMGSFFQFRSMAEIGYRFDDNIRLTGEFSHISDAKITTINPGAEIAGLYLHVPTSMIFGR